MNTEDLKRIGVREDRAVKWRPYLLNAMDAFQINTPARQAAFIAQILHESGMLKYTVELWGPTPAQSRYEGRKDLGNTQIGDGFKYRGRGLIQTTGRHNYTVTGRALALDLINKPELLALPVNAALSAGYFWESNGLNELADTGSVERVTRRVNGGVNGLHERTALHEAALQVLA